jgi:hypothetical protein
VKIPVLALEHIPRSKLVIRSVVVHARLAFQNIIGLKVAGVSVSARRDAGLRLIR